MKRGREDEACLYVVKGKEMICEEADLKDYDLYCFEQADSDRVFALYYGFEEEFFQEFTAYRIPLMDVEVRKPIELKMPLVIDFGSTNTTAGVYLDSLYFEEAQGAPFTEGFEKIRFSTRLLQTEGS